MPRNGQAVLRDAVGPAVSAVFLTGAGISRNAPSCGPLGDELTSDALCDFFEPEASSMVKTRFSELGMPGGVPRLETVLDVVSQSFPSHLVAPYLRNRLDVPPNSLHHFFAEHLRSGGSHITANVDRAIERALGSADVAPVHLHGVLAEHGGVASLGLTLALIENGLDPAVASELDRVLGETSPSCLIVAGYSSSDYFDVIPYLRERAPRLRHMQVIWLDHAPTDLTEADEPAAPPAASTVRMLRAAGLRVLVFRGDTTSALRTIAEVWGMVAPAEPEGACDRDFSPPELDDSRRARASVLLYAQLGLPGALRDLRARHPGLVDPTTAASFAEAEWDAGNYREVARLWRMVGDESPEYRWRRAERDAACDWITGRYLRARRKLVAALIAMDAEDAPETWEVRILAADTLARVLDQMSLLPDTRLLPQARTRRLALGVLENARDLPRDLRIRVDSSRAKLEKRLTTSSSASESHLQSSSVSRTLAYRGGELRARAASGERVPPEQFRALRKSWVLIGGWGSGGRMVTIPGFWPAFPLRECVSIVFDRRVTTTCYHRFRLLAGVLAVRLLSASATRR